MKIILTGNGLQMGWIVSIHSHILLIWLLCGTKALISTVVQKYLQYIVT